MEQGVYLQHSNNELSEFYFSELTQQNFSQIDYTFLGTGGWILCDVFRPEEIFRDGREGFLMLFLQGLAPKISSQCCCLLCTIITMQSLSSHSERVVQYIWQSRFSGGQLVFFKSSRRKIDGQTPNCNTDCPKDNESFIEKYACNLNITHCNMQF